jgi:hypothetical protein
MVDFFRYKRLYGDNGSKKVVVCSCLHKDQVLIMLYDPHKKFEVN